MDNDSLGGIFSFVLYQPYLESESTNEDEGENEDSCDIQVYDNFNNEFIGDPVTILYTAASYPLV